MPVGTHFCFAKSHSLPLVPFATKLATGNFCLTLRTSQFESLPSFRFGVPVGTRTPDPRLRRPMLYPAELLAHNGAGEGNRTLTTGLEGQGSTIELHPQKKRTVVGVAGFEPATLWSQTRCATKLRYTPIADENYSSTTFSLSQRKKRVFFYFFYH